MKLSVPIFAIVLSATSAHAEIELEGREGLTLACRRSQENTDAFCACLADSAVKELSRYPRQELYLSWISPTHFNFRRSMSPSELPEAIDQMWGAWQRKAVPACNNTSK